MQAPAFGDRMSAVGGASLWSLSNLMKTPNSSIVLLASFYPGLKSPFLSLTYPWLFSVLLAFGLSRLKYMAKNAQKKTKPEG